MLDQLRKEVQQAGDVSYMSVDITTMNDLLDHIEAQSEVVEAARGLAISEDMHGPYIADEGGSVRRLREALDNLEEQTDD